MSIGYLLKMLDEVDNNAILAKMMKLVVNLVREIPDEMES